jgi:hypothetical protein
LFVFLGWRWAAGDCMDGFLLEEAIIIAGYFLNGLL